MCLFYLHKDIKLVGKEKFGSIRNVDIMNVFHPEFVREVEILKYFGEQKFSFGNTEMIIWNPFILKMLKHG